MKSHQGPDDNYLSSVETDDMIGLYLKEVGRVPLLTATEEVDLAQRIEYFITQLHSNRVVIAFCVDLVLFTIFQVILMGAVIPRNSEQRNSEQRGLRFIPFFGLAIWLII